MNFKIIDTKLENCYQEIRQRIRRLQSGGTLDSLQDIGVETSHQIGASYLSLKQLASHYSPDEELALLLWNTGEREEQIIACLLLPTETNREKITQLTFHCLSVEIAGYLGSLYLCRRSDIMDLAHSWPDSKNTFQQIAILTAMARHLILYKEDSYFSKEFFHSVLSRKYQDKYVRLIAERYRFNI